MKHFEISSRNRGGLESRDRYKKGVGVCGWIPWKGRERSKTKLANKLGTSFIRADLMASQRDRAFKEGVMLTRISSARFGRYMKL